MNLLYLFSLIEILFFYLALHNISHIRIDIKNVLISTFLVYCLTLVSYCISTVSASLHAIIINILLVLFATVTLYTKKKNFPLCFLYGLFADVIYLLTGSVYGTLQAILYEVLNIPIDITTTNAIIYLVSVAPLGMFIYFTSRVFGNYINKKLNIFTEPLKEKLAKYLVIGALITLALFLSNMFLPSAVSDPGIVHMVHDIILVIYFIYLIFAVYAFTDNLKKEIVLRHKEETLQNLRIYTDSIENMQMNMRKFQHDHVNLLLGFWELINENDIEGIRSYFVRYISPFTEGAQIQGESLSLLQNIAIPELKSILSLKLMHAQCNKIAVNIEVRDTIKETNLDSIDICRITGILLDNAIEACGEAQKPELSFAAFLRGAETVFIFSNTFQIAPSLDKINKKGFSTKQDGRGLGLYTVKNILDGHKNVTLNTGIEGNNFIQQLTIG